MVDSLRLLKEFKKLTSFDSESYNEQEIAGYLFRKLEDLGLSVKMDDAGNRLRKKAGYTEGPAFGNIYGLLEGNTGGEPVLFCAHMDTVSPGKGKMPVFHPDGRVTSDGTTVLGADDTTGIAAILEALTVIKENALSHPDIEVVFFVAEEPYCRGSSVFDYSLIRSKQAYVFDLDGKIGTIANRAPSIISFKVMIEGKSAHAGFEPENGISSILVAALAISGLETGRIDCETTANIGLIKGGTGRNIVPGSTVVEGEVRSLNASKARALIKKYRSGFAAAAEKFGAKIIFEAEEMISAYSVSKNAQVIKRYEKALKELGYGPAELITTFGGSDNNSLNRHGIEGIVVSNAMNNVHTTGEYFFTGELVKSAEIAVRLML
ncbi:MAG: M20/M25/M40 family metallo-hydrolase [Lachnospiraceae bacterium]|nr:M20/M25/M40 family metallo-hydrolase [Lachnospiraceae bacterium]